MSNSSMVSCTVLSPHHSGKRTKAIDRISVHCMAGNLTVESCGALFKSREASSNYGIGSDGRVGLYVDEANRSWCTSSFANDQRAVTIEVANTVAAEPWPVSDKAYDTLIKLIVDICQRNGKTKVVWFPDKTKALSYEPKAGEVLLTVHRWFAAKACPGDFLFKKHGEIVNKVNATLEKGVPAATEPAHTPSVASSDEKEIKATGVATKLDKALSGTYTVTASALNVRHSAGINNKIMTVIPRGTKVQCYGYYTPVGGVKWLYVMFTYKGVTYTGFCSSAYLKK